ncbi:unnamed protein product [Danaus chrysippus]|uniref:(African queen) hypothetical protein n=1 Tax=Danaus chrysippus TaxID=151541 RepID=A0A8J2W6V3_9NEOP|nr:unnamed protein product [Danaus chrysippus]
MKFKKQTLVSGDTSEEEIGHSYLGTLMYGRYQRDLSEAAREEARRLRRLRKKRRKDDKLRQKELEASGKHRPRGRFFKVLGYVWRNTFARLGEDWVFLALLGIIMAVLNFAMDKGIAVCNNARMWMYKDLATSTFSQYIAWVSLPVCLILFAAGFVHIVAAQSIGSGIPEMKTILRGVHLKEYLTFRAMVSKVIGLTATLGSGLPLGKEGPSVHIASMVATLLSKLVTTFQGIYSNESRTSEMLAAACAVGVASCFAAPVGGVLFSIEVTTTYFAVRNYWRGFFAACCSAIMFRLLSVWSGALPTVKPLFPTSLPQDFPFDPQEFAVFVLLGIVCGLMAALWVFLHRQYVLFMRNTKVLSNFLQKNRFIYPGVMTLVVMSVLFPPGIGKYMAADLGNQEQVLSLFSNFTWSDALTAEQAALVDHWRTEDVGHFAVLVIYFFSIVIRWGKSTEKTCYICGKAVGTAKHLLVGCKVLLDSGQYSRRHDRVLEVIREAVSLSVARAQKEITTNERSVGFVREGTRATKSNVKPYSILKAASDWTIMMDTYEKQYKIPEDICASASRPDIFLFSRILKRVVMIELTVPWETNIPKDHTIKVNKYYELTNELTRNRFVVDLYAVEVGARGITAKSLYNLLKDLGLSRTHINAFLERISKAALVGSFQIWLGRERSLDSGGERITRFFLSMVSCTLPVPAGIFVPAFKMGAALGRFTGEVMHYFCPLGVAYGGHIQKILPGGYATVGAAAFTGAVTHTVSTIVICIEMTGQVTHLLPIMAAVLSANATAALLQPSCFDSIILIKKLPYLPDLLSSASRMYDICVEDFMVRDVKYIWNRMTFQQLKDLLKENKSIKSFPLVSSPSSPVLLGSIHRWELVRLIEQRAGRARRLQVAALWRREAEARRRPSRFEVTAASLTDTSKAGLVPPPGQLFRPKSILKKTNSFTLTRGLSSPSTPTTPQPNVYTTVTGAETRIRAAFEAIFKRSTLLPDVEGGLGDHGLPRSPSINKKVQLPRERVCDMSPEDQRAWEMMEMSREIDFDRMLTIARHRDMTAEESDHEDEDDSLYVCHIDPAPFQLVERTSLLKVHSLFSTLGVSRAYVTAIGRLIGVVALKELRKAIEDVNSGTLTPSSHQSPVTSLPVPRPPTVLVQPPREPAPPSDKDTDKLTVVIIY